MGFNATIEDRMRMMSSLFTEDHVKCMRVALEQELARNVLWRTPPMTGAADPNPRRWERFDIPPENAPALFPGSLADRAGDPKREAKTMTGDNDHAQETENPPAVPDTSAGEEVAAADMNSNSNRTPTPIAHEDLSAGAGKNTQGGSTQTTPANPVSPQKASRQTLRGASGQDNAKPPPVVSLQDDASDKSHLSRPPSKKLFTSTNARTSKPRVTINEPGDDLHHAPMEEKPVQTTPGIFAGRSPSKQPGRVDADNMTISVVTSGRSYQLRPKEEAHTTLRKRKEQLPVR